MNGLLTESDIERINQAVESNPDYLETNIILGGQYHYDVVRVSQIHKLILIEGNQYTGLKHIKERHDYYHSRTTWDKGKLGNGSKFSRTTNPHSDYVKIADIIIETGERIYEDNDRGYERYDALLNIDDKECFYKLLLHKGTKIIHALYPIENVSVWVRPNKFNFMRYVGLEGDIINNIKTVIIDYRNKKGESVYKIFFKKQYLKRIESIEIKDIKVNNVFWTDNIPLRGSYNFSPIDTMIYGDEDLRVYENKILAYEDCKE